VAHTPASLAALSADIWIWRPEVVVPLALVAGAYAVGWWRLSRRGEPAPGWRAGAGGAGVLSLAIALSSPLDRMAHASFAAHMLQHLLLITFAAPLLLLADPFAALLWVLPSPLRAAAGRLLRPALPLRRLGLWLTALPVAWVIGVLVIWLWHLPIAYDAAGGDRLVHDVEHLAFFASAVVFWWPIVQPHPRLRPAPSYGARVVYLVLAALQGGLLGLLLASSARPWYRGYANLEDQSLGGLVMWGLGGAVDMLAVLVLVWRYLASQDRAGPAERAGAPVSPR
jgi:putative membrane protein